ncbi:MAG: MFS transporter [Candidatus Aureabacteria bacterium]|nr:MFS transporter [Candidatus Auribacterota bacterium]
MRGLGLDNVFRALHARNFRLFFAGQGISLVGTWMQHIAMSWLVYRLTGSPFLLGLVAFSSQIPAFILGPFSGVLADRWNRHRILIVTQTLAMIQAFLLALLTFSGIVAVWHVILLGILLGCVNSIDIPARHSFIFDMVERKEIIGNAVALNSAMFNAARLIGPSVAGVIIAVAGEGWCFLLNAVSFIAVIWSLLIMRLPARLPARRRAHMLAELREGIVYAFGFAPIRAILLLVSVCSLMGMPYMVLMPVFAKDILHGGPWTLGFLMASAGVGALVGTLYLASRQGILRLGRMMPVATAIFGAGLTAFAFSRALWLSLGLLCVAGFGMMVQMALSNTILQVVVDDDKRGRVLSFFATAFMGMMPLGSLFAGMLARAVGAPLTLALGGMACIAAAGVFAMRLSALKVILHPIYGRLGGIPAVISGINRATELSAAEEE